MRAKYLLFIIVLLIAGRNHLFANFTLTSPSLKDPNYISRIEGYNNILESSLIPVLIIDQNDLSEEIKTSMRIDLLGELYGSYIINTVDETFPDEFIFININHPLETIVTTFFHEYQHYQCRITNCYCFNPNFLPEDEQIVFSILREKHAMENELKRSLELKDPYLVKDVFLSISKYILYNKSCTYKMPP